MALYNSLQIINILLKWNDLVVMLCLFYVAYHSLEYPLDIRERWSYFVTISIYFIISIYCTLWFFWFAFVEQLQRKCITSIIRSFLSLSISEFVFFSISCKMHIYSEHLFTFTTIRQIDTNIHFSPALSSWKCTTIHFGFGFYLSSCWSSVCCWRTNI